MAKRRPPRNRTRLELKHTGEAYLGQEEGLFLEQGGGKRRLAKETYSYRIGGRQFLNIYFGGNKLGGRLTAENEEEVLI